VGSWDAHAAPAPPIVVVALLLSLAPDLDTPKSLIGALCPPLSRCIERTVGHRTLTHSLAALAVVAGASYLLVPAYWPILAGAYASHLAVDLLIGIHGITLLWPSRASLTLAGWRNDGPAPRRLLLMVLPITLLATAWPQLHPLLAPTLDAAASVANPLATPKPTPATPTPVPPITLHLALPAGVGLSALRVHVGDTLHEGQLLARWEPPATPTPLPPVPLPAPLPAPASRPFVAFVDHPSPAVAEADAALAALTTAQTAERAALLAAQQRAIADLQRRRDDAQRTLAQRSSAAARARPRFAALRGLRGSSVPRRR
jgi:membrane-bound metal-dependent hydrolase YbcI (DUF457 family)